MSEIYFRPEAEADLLAIALHVAEASMPRAKKLVARLRSRCQILREFPLAGRPRPEFGDFQLPVFRNRFKAVRFEEKLESGESVVIHC